MERLTTDTPKDNTSSVLNLFYINENETWVRGAGPAPNYPDISLYDYIREIIKKYNLEISTESNDAMGEHIYETLFDGIDTIEGIVSTLYTAAWAFSEIREQLKKYEDIGLEPEEVTEIMAAHGTAILELPEYRQIGTKKHLLELAQAEKDGRLVVLPCKVGAYVWVDGRKAIVEEFFGYKTERYLQAQFYDNMQYVDIPFEEIGKTVFLTREEAEAALKKREEPK